MFTKKPEKDPPPPPPPPPSTSELQAQIAKLQSLLEEMQAQLSSLQRDFKVVLETRFQPEVKLEDIQNLLRELRVLRGDAS